MFLPGPEAFISSRPGKPKTLSNIAFILLLWNCGTALVAITCERTGINLIAQWMRQHYGLNIQMEQMWRYLTELQCKSFMTIFFF